MSYFDIATLSLVGFFLMTEAAHLARGLLPAKAAGGDEHRAARIRPLAFLFFLASDLSVSFIPLAAKELAGSTGQTPLPTLLGLPITAEMLCAGVTAVCGGHLIDSRGWRMPFYAGLAVLGAGMLASGAAQGLWTFVLARALVGTGYGLAWMAMRGYVAAGATQAAKARGFAQLNAGIYAGNICACVIGGYLAERLGFQAVFLVGATVLCLAAGYAMRLGPGGAAHLPGGSGRRALEFLGDASVLSLCLLVTIPATVCLVGFLNWHFPLLAGAQGYPPSVIGKAFMVYGVCIIWRGPACGKIIANNPEQLRKYLLLGGCTGAGALLLYSLTGGFAAAVAAIVLMGLADSLGLVAQNTFLLGLSATRAYGAGKALGMFSMVKKAGQMLGPLVFAWATALGPQAGVLLLGAAYLAALAAFSLGTRGAAMQTR
jgi:MFS family permease